MPTPSAHYSISLASDDLLILIKMDLAFHHKKFENKLLKKTLIISNYFNDLGNKADINFSATLTETLKEKLEV